MAELDAAELPRTASTVSDRVAFAEMTFSGRVPPATTEAGQEVANLIVELRNLGWLPKKRALAPAPV
jgi:chromosome partitioning protein